MKTSMERATNATAIVARSHQQTGLTEAGQNEHGGAGGVRAGSRFRLSSHQRAILEALRDGERGWLPSEALHAAVWGTEFPRRHSRRARSFSSAPFTATQRASLSRSLRRLVGRGLVRRLAGAAYALTEAGRACVNG